MAVIGKVAKSFRSFRRITPAVACIWSSIRPLIEENHSILSSSNSTKGFSRTYMEHLKNKFGWVTEEVPCFGISGRNVHVLNEPIDFYETFKAMVVKAKSRIVIASLYLGTSPLETELIECFHDACEKAVESGSVDFEICILLDHTRGSRGGEKSSRAMLQPLIQKYGERVKVYLYHTPDLRGWLKRFVPERFDEVVGLTHMKIYLVDTDFIISGANLSDSYFTNRQDRYIQFKDCVQVSNYLTDLVKAVADISFQLQSDNTTKAPVHIPHPYEDSHNADRFKAASKSKILAVLDRYRETNYFDTKGRTGDASDCEIDTWIFPLIQMGPFGICDDEHVTKTLLCKAEESDRIFLASGYFNLTEEYIKEILHESRAQFHILTASPLANGFYGSRGISGYIPDSYTYIAKQFLQQVCSYCQDNRISMYEYYRSHWTFHCKGLWYYLPNSTLPVLTFIGSPNFGYRSVYRDLECQLAVITNNCDLQKQLKQEHERLFQSSTQVTEKTFLTQERYVPLWVRLVNPIIKHFF